MGSDWRSGPSPSARTWPAPIRSLGTKVPGVAINLGYDDFQIIHSKNDIRFALLGGSIVGPPALLRFYVLHCVFLPVVAGS